MGVSVSYELKLIVHEDTVQEYPNEISLKLLQTFGRYPRWSACLSRNVAYGRTAYRSQNSRAGNSGVPVVSRASSQYHNRWRQVLS
jgi:hypothetical protein